MSEFVPKKLHLREVLLHYFLLKKSAAETYRLLREVYGEYAPSERNCRFWFERFKAGDFDVNDKEREGAPTKFDDAELKAILDEDCSHTLVELSEVLGVDPSTVSKRLHAIGMVQKAGNWLPRELKERDVERRLVTCEMLLQRQQRKGFLHRIITGDEKWIHYDNPKRIKGWVPKGSPGPSTAKRNIHSSKIMLCIWWDQKGVVYYELLKPSETITGDRYRLQLIRLKRAIQQKRPEWDNRHDKLILQHDNARPHVAQPVRTYLEGLDWEVLPHPPYSPDIAPSDYHLFRSMQSALTGTRFTSYDDIKNWLDEWIASKDQGFFAQGLRSLPERWAKVVASDGAYFE
jgi:histone-lysine N-methyltransferase SETMAR